MSLKPHILWCVKIGDLVQFKEYPTGDENDVAYINGVVVSDIHAESQMEMWPYVDVYVFKSGQTRRCDAGCLEIISNS